MAGSAPHVEGRAALSRGAPLAADSALLTALQAGLGTGRVVGDKNELIVYECDGFTVPRAAARGGVRGEHGGGGGGGEHLPGAWGGDSAAGERNGIVRRNCGGDAERADQPRADEQGIGS